MYVEGLVHITELGGEYFRFDEARQELRGERTGARYAIGTRVRIQVSRVDLDGRRIDFRLVQDVDGVVGRTMDEKGVPRNSKLRSEMGERHEEKSNTRGVFSKAEPRDGVAGKKGRPERSVAKPVPMSKKTAKKRR
jgi:ribonuclease R